MKKRILASILSLVMLIGLIPTAVFADAAGDNVTSPYAVITPEYDWYGNGSADKFTITSVEDLVGLSQLTKGAVSGITNAAVTFADKTVALGADIIFADDQYWYYNDGTKSIDYRITGTFAGHFDGKNVDTGENYKIEGLKFYNADINQNPYMYLFNNISSAGSVKNLTLDTVTANINGYDYFGFIAYTLNGTATNCHVKNVTAYVDVAANGKGYIASTGAMFGKVISATVSNCSADGISITCVGEDTTDSVGALIGSAGGDATKRTTIEKCSVSNVTFDCTQKTKNMGGFIGSTSNTEMTDCTATNVKVYVDNYYQNVGGFVGIVNGASVFTNCNVIGFTMDGDTGTVCGDYYANVTGDVGGFAGYTPGKTISFSQCTVSELTVNLEIDNSGGYSAGGFIGWQSSSDITVVGCSVSGSITAAGEGKNDPVGGFIGVSNNTSTGVKISNCDTAVAITTTGTAGGFVGTGKGGDFTDCEVTGDVTSTNGTAGGFIGEISSTAASGSVTINGCGSTGTVTGTNDTEDTFVGAMPEGIYYNYNENAFESINISLGVDISVNYYVKSSYENAQIRFTINEYEITVNGELIDGQCKFVFTGVAPQWMKDNIKAELIVGGEVVAIKNYSVYNYLTALKADYPNETALQSLIDSLLVYGGTAQTYLGYKTDALVSDIVPEAVSDIPGNKTCENGDTVTFTGATVYFNNTNRLIFRFEAKNTDGLSFELDGNTVEYVKSGAYYVITTDAIKATDFGHVYTLTAKVNGVQDAMLTYSVNSYASSMQNSENANMAALARALYNYGVAAVAYVNAQ